MKFPNELISYVGDVHLGRTFRTGVPFHRQGEREEGMFHDLHHKLHMCERSISIQPGDIFNAFSESEATVLRTAYIYMDSAKANPNVKYVILRGNHDASRDADKKSSFDLLAAILAPVENIIVATEVSGFIHEGVRVGLMPWHPFKSSTELATELLNLSNHYGAKWDCVVTHCEIKSFGGGDDSNLLPLNVLKHCTDLVYNGHIHQPQVYEQDGVTVVVTGSMQPYAHGEDVKGEMYVTMRLDELMMTDPDTLRNKNVRVLVKEDDVVPQIDCLSLITKRVEDVSEDTSPQVEMQHFDMNSLFSATLTEHGVGQSVVEQIMKKFGELKHG